MTSDLSTQKKCSGDTHAESGKLEPEDEDGLEREIPGEVVEDETESEALKEVKEAEHYPVGEPLDVVVLSRGFDSLDGKVSRQAPAEDVRDGGSEGVDSMEDEKQDNATEEGICFRHLGALLKRGQGRVLG